VTSCNQSQFDLAALIGEQARRHAGIRTNTDRDPRVTLIQPILKILYVLILFRCRFAMAQVFLSDDVPNEGCRSRLH
jgi:hypothetical protein